MEDEDSPWAWLSISAPYLAYTGFRVWALPDANLDGSFTVSDIWRGFFYGLTDPIVWFVLKTKDTDFGRFLEFGQTNPDGGGVIVAAAFTWFVAGAFFYGILSSALFDARMYWAHLQDRRKERAERNKQH